MAGMIQEQTKQQINGIPGLMQLPVFGALFKSRDYINKQTELMVIVTPYVVRAVARRNCRGRTTAMPMPPIHRASCSAASTASTASPGKPEPPVRYHGRYGFILD